MKVTSLLTPPPGVIKLSKQLYHYTVCDKHNLPSREKIHARNLDFHEMDRLPKGKK